MLRKGSLTFLPKRRFEERIAHAISHIRTLLAEIVEGLIRCIYHDLHHAAIALLYLTTYCLFVDHDLSTDNTSDYTAFRFNPRLSCSRSFRQYAFFIRLPRSSLHALDDSTPSKPRCCTLSVTARLPSPVTALDDCTPCTPSEALTTRSPRMLAFQASSLHAFRGPYSVDDCTHCTPSEALTARLQKHISIGQTWTSRCVSQASCSPLRRTSS